MHGASKWKYTELYAHQAGGKAGHGGFNAKLDHGCGGGGFLSSGDHKSDVHGPGPGNSYADGGGVTYSAYEDGSTIVSGSGYGGGGGHGMQVQLSIFHLDAPCICEGHPG